MAGRNSEHDKKTAGTERGRFAHLLNGSQQRSLTVMLRRVELAVWRLEERLRQQEPAELVLTHFTNQPDPRQRAALLRLIQQVRQEVAQLALDYDLEVSEENILHSIVGEFSLLWADLEDARPQKMRRYGPVNLQAHEALGPAIQRLIKLMLAINDVASGNEQAVRLWQEESSDDREDGEA